MTCITCTLDTTKNQIALDKARLSALEDKSDNTESDTHNETSGASTDNSEHLKEKKILQKQLSTLKTMFESLQVEYSSLKAQTNSLEIEREKVIHDLKEELRVLNDNNQKLKSR